MPMSTITVAGINPGLNILGATQQFNYTQSLSAFQITNSFIPGISLPSQFNQELRNNLFSGFRWSHITTSIDTFGSLTLQSFVNAQTTGSDIMKFNSSGIDILTTLNLNNLPGTSGQVLTSQGVGNTPIWTASGTVTSITAGAGLSGGTITTSGTISLSIPVSLANGGTNANLTPSNGGIFYSTATTGAILAGTATANQILLSGASGAPSWSTVTHPSTTTINQILYSSANNILSGIATANDGILITSAGGVPSIGTTLPTAVQGNITSVGTITSGTWNGNTITVPYGGTGLVSTTAYSIICGGTTSTGVLQSVASLGTLGQVLTSQGAGALPIWTTSGVVASLYMDGNIAPNYTPIVTPGQFVKIVGATSSRNLNSNFTSTSDNLITYIGTDPITAHVSVDLSAIPTASSTLTIKVYQNGLLGTAVKATNSNYQLTGGKSISLTVNVPIDFVATDFIEVFITSDIVDSTLLVSDMNILVAI
jgi:hypothetical protein